MGLAALQGDHGEAQGLSGALSSPSAKALRLVAFGSDRIGLGAYGLFGLAEAFYRASKPPLPKGQVNRSA